MSNNSSSQGGIGFLGLLTLVFIVLKLAEVGVVAAWSWWWVFSPIWIGTAVILVLALIVILLS